METWSWSSSVKQPDGTDVSPRLWAGRDGRVGVKECGEEVESKVGRGETEKMKPGGETAESERSSCMCWETSA